MGQITEDFAHQILRHTGHGQHPPLTVWEAEQLAHAWLQREVLRHERDHARAQLDNAVKLLTGIHNLLYPPPVTTPDGRTMVFRPENQHEFMQALSDRIRALPDEMVARGFLERPNATVSCAGMRSMEGTNRKVGVSLTNMLGVREGTPNIKEMQWKSGNTTL